MQHDLDTIFLIVNNGMYGTIRMHQEREYPTRVIATDLRNPDFVTYAAAFGAHGELVERTEDFEPALERALAAAGVRHHAHRRDRAATARCSIGISASLLASVVVVCRQILQVGADLVGDVAGRGGPVGAGDAEVDHAVLHQVAAGVVSDHRVQHTVQAELEDGQRRPLVARPGLVDPDMDRDEFDSKKCPDETLKPFIATDSYYNIAPQERRRAICSLIGGSQHGTTTMTTEKQIEANWQNAEKSTGPKSAEGKAVAKMNALKHGPTRC